MKKMVAEFLGTMTLVLFGCGAAVIAGGEVGYLGISFAFGLAIVAMAYGIGPISGCHINPAVTLGVVSAGRMSIREGVNYIIAQSLGGIFGAFLLKLIASDPGTLGSNVVSTNYSVFQGGLFELIFTFIFLVTILGVTQKGGDNSFAGLAIGLTLVVIHIVGIPVTGVSVNPARSLGPALVSMNPTALSQLWIFILFPIIGGVLAGFLFKSKIIELD